MELTFAKETSKNNLEGLLHHHIKPSMTPSPLVPKGSLNQYGIQKVNDKDQNHATVVGHFLGSFRQCIQ